MRFLFFTRGEVFSVAVLFPHNAEAYQAALDMLRDCGKAAVIHPTGTGKSFIAFQLAADHPDSRVLWLSPSEYIFKTQLENWAQASNSTPENLSFCTYARLMLLSPEELNALQPDTIVLDEFHRCGAEQWGAGVQRLLALYPDAWLLGLSATNIRYLDNQRDMADELFDGHIASEMTLGEAIVRGILNPPKYVLSVFRYAQSLEKYELRARSAKSRATRDAAEEILSQLRRALDLAEGMDRVFEKHMTDRTGKYLVFCANAEHMRDMIAAIPDWFHSVDPHPHVYSAYSADPETSRAFADFKADSSGHLKLLFCIDMLNEGIHVPDVSGVILLRPTISPIIYKQQIGRALSANRTTAPVIFDIVMNIDNLVSIGAIEDEMQLATAYYRSLGMDERIINESFTVIDEVHDCLALFDRLNDTLTATWDIMYDQARKYHAEYGNLDVPQRYVTPEGYSLGRWLTTQRRVRRGSVSGTLTPDQIARLDALGMRWESAGDMNWERYYAAAKQYQTDHGDLRVRLGYVTPDGLPLGKWLSNLRIYRRSDIKCSYLTPERIAALDALGMQWDVLDYLFERNYSAAVEYHRQNGNLDVPIAYVSDNGVRLGAWIGRLRMMHAGRVRGHLTPDQTARLDALGMQWDTRYDADWDAALRELTDYYRTHGDTDVPTAYITPSGLRLGRWIRRQRDAKKNGKLKLEREIRLNALTPMWSLS